MSILLVSDTHLGIKKSSDIWHDITLNLFQEIADVCLTRNIDTILHLGDFFHEKKTTNQKTLEYAYRIANTIHPLDMIIITGNHDIYYRERIKPSSLKCFVNIPNVRVIDTPVTLSDTLSLIPWGILEFSKGSFCFGHFEINGFRQNNTFVCSNNILSVDSFKHYQHVYSGHFHIPSTKGNITYIGSAFQQTFNDVGSTRGYYVFDNGDIEFIEYKDAPKFVRLHTEENIRNVEGNIVELIYDKDYGTNKNNEILESIERMNPLGLKPNFTNIIAEENDISSEDISLLNHDDIIREFLKKEKIPENLDKRVLLSVIEELKKG